MDNERIAKRLLKTAKTLVADEIREYEDAEEIADELADALTRHLDGSYEVNKNEIVFYEEETDTGEPARVVIAVNPRNQPEEEGIVKFGMEVVGEDGPTYDDGVWSWGNEVDISEVAEILGDKNARKVLDKN